MPVGYAGVSALSDRPFSGGRWYSLAPGLSWQVTTSGNPVLLHPFHFTFWKNQENAHVVLRTGIFIIAIIAAVFGFSGLAAGAAGIAKILFIVFLVMALATFVVNLMRGR